MEAEQRRELEAEAEAEAAEGGFDLQGRRPRQRNNVASTTTTVTVNGSGLSSEYSRAEYSLVEGGEFSYQSFASKSGDVIVDLTTKGFDIQTSGEITTNPPPSKNSLQEQIANDSYINIGTTEHGRDDFDFPEESEQKERDLYLERVCKKPDTYDFYCPNCKACIDKVLIRSRDDELRCPSCFAFLKPIGDWLFRKPVPTVPGNEDPTDQPKPEDTVHPAPPLTVIARRTPKQHGATKLEIPKGNEDPTDQPKPEDTVHPAPPLTVIARRTPKQHGATKLEIPKGNEDPTDQPKPEDTVHPAPPLTVIARRTPKQHGATKLEIPKGNEDPTDQPKPEDTVHPPPPSTLIAQSTPEQHGNEEPTYQPKPGDTVHLPPPSTPIVRRTPDQHGAIKLEILKSIVYGGLAESITSLSVVTSAASAAAATLNIVALALANLIGGLFIIGHNLRELKNDQSRVTSNETEEEVDRYLEVLGQKNNFIIHASVAVLSFLVFGLVPPVVYGFSFYKSDNRYLKLAVVAAASLICITVLAIAKAYIQKSPKWYMYLRTVLQYVALGVGASGISYLAGYLVRMLIDKLGWFESSAAVTLSLPGMSSAQPARGSQ